MITGRGAFAAVAIGAVVAVATALTATAADQASAPGSASRLVDGMSPQSLYLLRCSGCHRVDGLGAPSAGVPPFPGSIGAIASDPGGRAYIMHVPGVAGSGLKDAQLAEVMNYVLDRWSADQPKPAPRFNAEEVSKLRGTHVGDVVNYRRAMAARLAESGVVIADYPWP